MTKRTAPNRPHLSDKLQRHLDLWLKTLGSTTSPQTLKTYQYVLQDFGAFLQTGKLDDTCAWQISRQRLRSYFTQKTDKNNLNVTSLKLHLSAIRQFYAYLEKYHAITNPTIAFKITGKKQRLPKLIDIETLTCLLEQPAKDNGGLWVRDLAMFELLYGSGLRVAELVGLDVNDVDLSIKQVTVLGKGQKFRTVPIGKYACQALIDYLEVRQEWGIQKKWQETTEALFVSQHGKRLSIRSVQLRLEHAAKNAGIDRQLHPHLLRHAFASHILSSSGDLKAVQELLGHSSLSTTQIYTHLDFEALARVYNNTHPRGIINDLMDKKDD